MDVADPGELQREVAVLLVDVLLGTGDALGEPAAVGDRDEPVLDTVPDLHRNLNLLQLEPPWLQEDEVVVDPPVDPLADPFLNLLVEKAPQVA